MRTSFHHQPEAQHPKSPAIYTPAGRLPHLRVISEQIIAGQNQALSALVQKRTNAGVVGLSAKCQKLTHALQQLRVCKCMHVKINRSCGICLAPGFYVRAMAIFEVMLALTFPSLRSGARCAPMAAFNLRCVSAGNLARDGASGVAARALAA